jgi:hypothetical protein
MDPAIAAVVLSTHAMIHSRSTKAKPAPVKRPEVSSGGTTEGFLSSWHSYGQAVELNARDTTIQLLECCDQKLVTRNCIGPIPIEDLDLLKAIRALAVREENPRVALSRIGENPSVPSLPASEGKRKSAASPRSARSNLQPGRGKGRRSALIRLA